jgi:hypothetical protein
VKRWNLHSDYFLTPWCSYIDVGVSGRRAVVGQAHRPPVHVDRSEASRCRARRRSRAPTSCPGPVRQSDTTTQVFANINLIRFTIKCSIKVCYSTICQWRGRSQIVAPPCATLYYTPVRLLAVIHNPRSTKRPAHIPSKRPTPTLPNWPAKHSPGHGGIVKLITLSPPCRRTSSANTTNVESRLSQSPRP